LGIHLRNVFIAFVPSKTLTIATIRGFTITTQNGNVGYDHAIADYDQYVKLAPNDPDGFNNRGRAYMEKGEYDRGVAESDKRQYALAVEDYTRYIALKPSDPDGYDSRGNAYRREGQFEQAIADYNHALQLNRGYVFLDRGNAHFLAGQTSAARADFRLAIGADPSLVHAALWLHLVKERLHEDDTEDLRAIAGKADLSVWPGPVLKLYRGESTDNAVMIAAGNSDPQIQKQQVCEADFYTAENALLHQQRATALTRLHAARDGCPKDYIEYAAALAELKRVSASPAAPAK
jgi:lipoprotein NlpI